MLLTPYPKGEIAPEKTLPRSVTYLAAATVAAGRSSSSSESGILDCTREREGIVRGLRNLILHLEEGGSRICDAKLITFNTVHSRANT
jgi:hypothetical protein